MNILEEKEKYINEFYPHMQKLLRKMCEMVNTDVNKINFMEPSWYMKNSWTDEQQKEYEDWMADYLYNTTSARKEIMSFPRKNKKRCRDVAHHFAMWYGWKTEKPGKK
jgi:hypothetical protein